MPARTAIRDGENEVYVSAASVWEIAIKHALGKLPAGPLLDHASELLREQTFEELPVTVAHGVRAGALPLHHKDPFDRMLAAQAQAENLVIVSSDRVFDAYGIRRMW